MLAVLWWLAEVVPEKLAIGHSPSSFEIITGWGKSRDSWQTADIQISVLSLLANCGVPSKIHPRVQGRVKVDLTGVKPERLHAFFPSSVRKVAAG